MEDDAHSQGHHLSRISTIVDRLGIQHGTQGINLLSLLGNDLIAMADLVLEPAPLSGTIFTARFELLGRTFEACPDWCGCVFQTSKLRCVWVHFSTEMRGAISHSDYTP